MEFGLKGPQGISALKAESRQAIEARVAEAVKPAVDEAWQRIEGAAVKHTDGTSWLKAGTLLALWTIATTAATVFKIVTDGSRATLQPLYGALRGILVSDRATALASQGGGLQRARWRKRGVRPRPAQLHRHPVRVLARPQGWQARPRDLPRVEGPVRAQVEALLERAVAANIERLSGSCANILEHRLALWTFDDHDGVEPTTITPSASCVVAASARKVIVATSSPSG